MSIFNRNKITTVETSSPGIPSTISEIRKSFTLCWTDNSHVEFTRDSKGLHITIKDSSGKEIAIVEDIDERGQQELRKLLE